jgi:hypothetical protein
MKMAEYKIDRRSGVERRIFHYTKYIPEKRNIKDRRIGKNGKQVQWKKLAGGLHKGKQKTWFRGRSFFRQLLRYFEKP